MKLMIKSLILLSLLLAASCKKAEDKVKASDRGRFSDEIDNGSDDSTPPQIISITRPANRWYGLNQYLTFTVRFDEAVVVEGSPTIKLTTDAGERLASYYTGSGTTDIGFRYRITSADTDVDGIATDTIIDENDGSLTDSAGNVADLVLGAIDTSGIFIDPVIPQLTGITNVAPGYYRNSDAHTLSFTVSFDKVVYSHNNTRIRINIGSGTVWAYYSGGTGTQDITFTYTVGANDLDLDGITLVSPINVSGAYLRDIAQNNAVRNFTVPDTSQVMVTPNSLVMWLDAAEDASVLDGEGDAAGDPSFDDEVCQWRDRSYRANHMTVHGVDSNCLTYTDAALGGLPIVSSAGDAASQCMSANLNSGLGSTTAASMFSVVRSNDDLQATQTFFWGDSGVGAFPRLQTFDNLGVWNFTVGGADDYWEFGATAVGVGTWYLQEMEANAGSYVQRLDGVAQALTFGGGVAAVNTGTVNTIHLGCEAGGENNMNASMSEIFVFEAVLNNNSKTHIRNYLNGKWGL